MVRANARAYQESIRMSEQPLTPKDLARLIDDFYSWYEKEYGIKDNEPPTLIEFSNWLQLNDTNKNPHRYTKNMNACNYCGAEYILVKNKFVCPQSDTALGYWRGMIKDMRNIFNYNQHDGDYSGPDL